jgi:bifunctional non-homologous end joining protein LigD
MRRSARPAILPPIEPIVPILSDQPFDDPGFVFEPKYDGFRGVLYLSRRECQFRSKRGNLLKRFDDLAQALRSQLAGEETILDGEVIALDQTGRQDFRALVAGQGALHYAVFDVLWLNGKDLRPLSLRRRKQRLARMLPSATPLASRVFTVDQHGRALFAAAERLDLEGIVAKRKTDPYASQAVWLKVKNRAYTQMDGRWELFQHPRRP